MKDRLWKVGTREDRTVDCTIIPFILFRFHTLNISVIYCSLENFKMWTNTIAMRKWLIKVTKKTCKHPNFADVVGIVVRILISAEARIGMLQNCKTQQYTRSCCVELEIMYFYGVLMTFVQTYYNIKLQVAPYL